MTDSSLQKKMLRGTLWALVEKTGNQGISFLVFMFVARLIGPREYGLANICFVTFSISNLVILGLVDGIVSLQISDTRRLSTLFWCVIGGGATLTLSCFFGAGFVAEWMGEPRLENLLRCFSLVFLCLAGSAVPNKLIYAALDFRTIAIRTLVAAITSGVVGLTLAFMQFGAYAIVAQQITLYLVMNIIVWRSISWRPSFVFDASDLLENLHPGVKMMSADIVGFCQDQIPRMCIAGILGPVVLGYYAFVLRIRYALQDILINPSLTVLCPSLTTIKDDHDRQRVIVWQVISLMGFLIFPVLALGAAAAPLYVPLLFGEAWNPAIPVLQIFICGSVSLPIVITVREALRAHNRLGSYMKVQVPFIAAELLAVFLFLRHGLVAMSLGMIACSLSAVPVYIHFFRKWQGISLWQPIARLAWPVLAVGLMLAALYLYRRAPFYPANAWVACVSYVALGGVVYVGACFVLQRDEFIRMLTFLRTTWAQKKLA